MRTLRRLGQQEALVTLLEQVSPDLAARASGARPEGRIHGWAGVPGHVRRSWGQGWALVGDAGYFKDPITAHGITDALRDAELLAGAVHEVLADGVPECVALSRYQRTRDRLSAWLFEVTEAVAGYDWDTERIRHLLRQVSAAMTDEVEHLQALPDRRIGAGLSTIIPTDTAPMPG
jgi:flavin-dependent dehydrogenase